MRTGFLLALVSLLALLGAPACADSARERSTASAPISVIDDTGREVRLAAPARRVLSLIPARTDAILALGGADRLIARTRFDADPRLAALPSVGNALTPSVEWLAAQRPDLVVAWPDEQSRSVVTRLLALGIPVYGSRVETLADTRRAIEQLGVLLGLRARADSVLAAIEREHARVRAAVRGRARPRVLYLIGIDPITAVGPATFIHELIEIAGGENVFGDLGPRWPQVALEEVVWRDPEVIVIGSEEAARRGFAGRVSDRPGWRDVSAVRAGRVHTVDASLFNRPGPSAGTAAALLAQLLHADAFAEVSR